MRNSTTMTYWNVLEELQHEELDSHYQTYISIICVHVAMKWSRNSLETDTFILPLVPVKCIIRVHLYCLSCLITWHWYHTHLTLLHIQHIGSRRLWKYISNKREHIYRLTYSYWIHVELKALWQNEKLLIMSISRAWREKPILKTLD